MSSTGTRRREPLHQIESLGWVERDGVPFKQVGHHDKVAIGGELVGDELGVVEFVADDVREEEDCCGGLLGFGVGDVGVDCSAILLGSCGRLMGEGAGRTISNIFQLPFRSSLVLDADGAAFSWGVGGHVCGAVLCCSIEWIEYRYRRKQKTVGRTGMSILIMNAFLPLVTSLLPLTCHRNFIIHPHPHLSVNLDGPRSEG